MTSAARSIFKNFPPQEKAFLIPILQSFQERDGYISDQSIEDISGYLRISRSHIFGVASFYAQFKFNPPGRHSIKICLGTACHVQGGDFLLNALKSEIGIGPGETSEDGRFDLERVACLGCCALAPVVMINEQIHSRITVIKLKEVLTAYE